MIATLDIVLAAVVGVLIAAMFEGRLLAVLLATPAVALVQGVLLLVAPGIERSGAPPIVKTIVAELADPLLLAAVVVASGTGAVVTSFLLRRAKGSAEPGFWLPDMERKGRPGEPGRSARRAPRGLERLESQPKRRSRDLLEKGYGSDVPVLQIDDRGTAGPAAALAGELTPSSKPQVEAAANLRGSARRRTLLAGFLETDAGVAVNCAIKNLSAGGAQVRVSPDVPLIGKVHLIDITNGLAHECQVSWRSGPNTGLSFVASYDLRHPPNPRAAALASLWAQLAPR